MGHFRLPFMVPKQIPIRPKATCQTRLNKSSVQGLVFFAEFSGLGLILGLRLRVSGFVFFIYGLRAEEQNVYT